MTSSGRQRGLAVETGPNGAQGFGTISCNAHRVAKPTKRLSQDKTAHCAEKGGGGHNCRRSWPLNRRCQNGVLLLVEGYAGIDVSELPHLKPLADENNCRKRLVGDLSLTENVLWRASILQSKTSTPVRFEISVGVEIDRICRFLASSRGVTATKRTSPIRAAIRTCSNVGKAVIQYIRKSLTLAAECGGVRKFALTRTDGRIWLRSRHCDGSPNDAYGRVFKFGLQKARLP